MFYVYVLRNLEGRLYIGSTQDLDGRVTRHKSGGVRWTSQHGPWELAYSEAFETRAEAVRRERVLKTGRANQELRQRLSESGGHTGGC